MTSQEPAQTVPCLKCVKPIPCTIGTCPHCEYVEFTNTSSVNRYMVDMKIERTIFPETHYGN